MKNLIAIVVALAGLLAIPHPVAAQCQARAEGPGNQAPAAANVDIDQLVGAWAATIDLQVQGNGFQSLLTFTSDGIVLADEPGAFETTGHGAWGGTGRRTGAFTFRAFLGSPTGAMTGRIKVAGTVRLSSKQRWTGDLKVDVFDANGTLVFSDIGTVRAERIVAERLD